MVLDSIPQSLGQTTQALPDAVTTTIFQHPYALIAGILFIGLAIFFLLKLKNIIINSVLGLVGWGLLTYVFHVQLPFWASLLISALFGLAGLGTLLVLGFLGII